MHRMKWPSRILMLGFLVFATALVAAPHTVNLTFDHLQLSGSAPLGPGVIRTFDPVNGRVMLQVGQAARSVSIEQLPVELQQRLKALVPYVPDKPAIPSEKPVASTSTTSPASANAGTKANSATSAKENMSTEEPAASEAVGESTHVAKDPRETARAAAKLFLSRNKFAAPAASSSSKTLNSYVLDEAVEPAVGAEQRYLVTGHYEVKVPNRTGGGSLIGTYPFTVNVLLDPAGSPREISIELH